MPFEPIDNFLDEWKAKHIRETVPQSRIREWAEQLAVECERTAAIAGFSSSQLSDACDGDLIAYMENAIFEADLMVELRRIG